MARRPENDEDKNSIDPNSPRVNQENAHGERKLLDQVREVLRLKHYAIRTEEAYVDWIKRYILFHNKRLPVVRTRAEARQIIDGMTGAYQLMAKLLAKRGSGLRLMECVRLRVKLLHEQDLAAGFGHVYLPYALDRKYPNASREWS